MIEPVQKNEELLGDIRDCILPSGHWRMWWLGQSGFLIDPYLSDSLTRKYADTDKQHVRMTERVLSPEQLNFVDIVTSSHNHTDHLDAETLLPILRGNPDLSMIIPEANRSFVADRLQCDYEWPIGLADGIQHEVKGFRFIGIPAAHENLEIDELGRHRFMGYVITFGGWSIYHSGDTLRYEGMSERLKSLDIDVALLPINGHNPARRVAGNLNGREAACLAKDIDVKVVIPCHYDMFTFNTASPESFESACKELNQAYHIMQNGEGLSSESVNSHLS